IDAECKKQGLEKYKEIIKAKVMQESGGNYKRYPDVFQASESLGLPVNSIGLEKSIQQGVKYFGQMVKKAGGDIRLALQAYNFGGGFIGYVKKRGSKMTQKLVDQFSNEQARKLGWSRYGDKNYVKNVLRYYKGSLEECSTSGGTDDAPTVLDAAGKKKYHLSANQAKQKLVNPKTAKDRKFGITIVGSSPGLMRKGSYQLLNEVAKEYKKKTGDTINLTSSYRPGDPNWHGTGYAVDIDTPNTMRTLSGGKLGFPKGKHRDNAKLLCEIAIQKGFNGICFGDWFIGQELKKKYKNLRYIYLPKDHHNHLHLSYPEKKKK